MVLYFNWELSVPINYTEPKVYRTEHKEITKIMIGTHKISQQTTPQSNKLNLIMAPFIVFD